MLICIPQYSQFYPILQNTVAAVIIRALVILLSFISLTTMGTPQQDRHLCCSTNFLALHTTTWRSRLVAHAGICLFPDGVFKGLFAGCLMPNVLLEVSISTHLQCATC